MYSARPGSRIWEASFNGEVLSTHQFKQPLACPALPLITYRYWLLPLLNYLLQKAKLLICFLNLSFFPLLPAEMSHITTHCRRAPSQSPSLNCFILGNVRYNLDILLSELLGLSITIFYHVQDYWIRGKYVDYIRSIKENCYSITPGEPVSWQTVHFIFMCRDQNLLTWTDSAIYIFTPQNGQMLLWTEVKGVFVLLPPKIPPAILWCS